MCQSENHKLIMEANSFLETIENHVLKSKSKTLYPMSESYGLLLGALKHVDFSRVPAHDMVGMIEQLSSRVQRQIDEGNTSVKMSAFMNNTIMNALSTAAINNDRAIKMVDEIMKDPDRSIDDVSYSIAIKTLTLSKNWGDEHTSHAQAIQDWLIKGVGRPNHKTMTPILTALAKQAKVTDIMFLLEWMESLYHENGWDDVRPNRFHFNTMISALSHQKSTFGKGQFRIGTEALQILDKMKKLYLEGNNDDVRPDIVTFNAVLNAIANERITNKKEETGARAEELLQRLEQGKEGKDIVPDIVSYNSVLSAYAKSSSPDASFKMQNILDRMRSFNIEPDLKSFTICINTLSKNNGDGSAQKAEEFLKYLEDCYAAGKNHLKPDVACYNAGELGFISSI